jgi:hypothetical protein
MSNVGKSSFLEAVFLSLGVTIKPAGEKHNEAKKALLSNRLCVMRDPLSILSHNQAHV